MKTHDSTATLLRVEAVEENALAADMQLIIEGVHYIQDGEPVAVSETAEVRR